MNNQNPVPRWQFWKTFAIVIAIVVVFAYGFQVTKINLEEPKEEQRQEQLLNVMRSLARPDLFTFETERIELNLPIYIPCPAGDFTLPEVSQSGGPAATLSAACAEPGSEMTITGSGFQAGDQALIFFVPFKADKSEEVQLPLANAPVKVDDNGNFSIPVELKKGRTAEEPQKVRVVVNRPVGLPSFSDSVVETVEKIIETVFLALIATTLGTLLSIPVSFLAARNLMIQVTTVFGGFVTLIVVAPVGWFAGAWLFSALGGWGVNLFAGGEATAALLLAAPVVVLSAVQALGSREREAGWAPAVRQYGLGILIAIGAALVLGLIAGLGKTLGASLIDTLGAFGFLGNFLFVAFDGLAIFLPIIGGLAGLFAFTSIAGRASESLFRQVGNSALGKIYTIIISVLAGAVVVGLPAAFVRWLYQLENPTTSVVLPAAIGSIALGIIGVVTAADRPMPTGLIIYYVTRTILNVLRAIEPLIMAIVFVVWVGIGPFAGVLALTLHTIAALGKLYSEQVENISQGPIEAVTATGANRLQTIIYAVIPQIVPPYIAFTIYRWDINVRMSTIIGFAGGGGIGFLLQQNLNLLKYRQAAVQMLAIAIVVASLDYISAKIREKII
jgi:phosphonate ABC transporter permease subunit PhnE